MFIQLLPGCLRAGSRCAVIAFLDFVKAYDTVSRGLLFAVMRAMGIGGGFLRLVQMLLSRTQFVAMVNVFLLQPALSAEGARQGCLLAPLLFMFMAQALHSFLCMCCIPACHVRL